MMLNQGLLRIARMASAILLGSLFVVGPLSAQDLRRPEKLVISYVPDNAIYWGYRRCDREGLLQGRRLCA
jgi:hypothetical protein